MRITQEPEFSKYHLSYQACITPFHHQEIYRSIIDRFQKIVARQPGEIAIDSGSEALSYRELNNISDQIAAQIPAAKTGRKCPISLVFENTAYLIAAIFGVLKSGHPYLVLDSDYPHKRLALMLKDSCSRQVIAQGRGVELSKQLDTHGIQFYDYEEMLSSIGHNPITESIDSDTPALIMYTSGSTGAPQGVIHTHRSLLAEVFNITNSWNVGSRDKFLLLSSCAFASSLRTIFGALLNGGTVVPYNIGKHGFIKLGQTIEECGVTILRSLPTTFRHYLNTIDSARKFENVRIVSLGGETVTPTDVRLFNRHFSKHAVLVLSFGPTECLTACWGFVNHGEEPLEHRVPMGFERPSKNILLIDSNAKEVKSGESGELTVISNFLAEGYWNNTAATRARFVKNIDGTRTFFSGDIAVKNSDGSYTHLGRKDFQVKVRGYRIDVFEIENILREFPGIHDAVAIGQQDASREMRIIGFLMVEPGYEKPAAPQLREFLGKRLPKYMIPAMFNILDSFPLNSNGKLDRRALPKVEQYAIQDIILDKPRSSSSIGILHSLWAEALKLEQVPLDKDFMSLGGDSLKAIEVAFRIKERFGIDISLAHILDRNSLLELSEYVEEKLS